MRTRRRNSGSNVSYGCAIKKKLVKPFFCYSLILPKDKSEGQLVALFGMEDEEEEGEEETEEKHAT